jgi:tetratricopeptide (TPR) repeat protein
VLSPDLQPLRWETLPDPASGRALALDGDLLLSRYLSADDDKRIVLRPRGALRALVAVAAPADAPEYGLAGIDAATECARIKAALGDVPMTMVSASWETLGGALRNGYDILYLVAHGALQGGQPWLYLVDTQGNADRRRGGAFVDLIRSLDVRQPRLVVLASCESAGDGYGDAAAALGPLLVQAGVPAVLAMQGKLGIATNERFAPVFFRELLRDGASDRAINIARLAVADDCPDWWAPVLLTRVRDGLIWVPPRPTVGLGRGQRVVVALIALLVALAAAAVLLVTLGPMFAPPAPMTGSFNVAVAEFGALDGDGRARPSPAGRALASTVYAQLSSELPQLGFTIDVRGPDAVRALPGSTLAAQDAAARSLAAAIHADIVIYGYVSADGTTVEPRIYIADRQIRGAEELEGQHELGAPLRSAADIATNFVAREEIAAAMRERSGALTRFIIGVNYYALKNYARAREWFEIAAETPGWERHDGKEVLYLFLGNTEGRLGDLAAAERHFNEAAAIRAGYARALVGLGEVKLLRAVRAGACEPGGDQAIIEQAKATFQSALEAPIQPPASDIPVKVAFNLGRAYLCQSTAGAADRYTEAEAEFARVVAAYEAGDARTKDRLRFRAAQAYANLALVYLPETPTAPRAEERYKQALDAYDRALLLTDADETGLRATYQAARAFIYCRLGQADEALAAYDAALVLAPGNTAYMALRAQLVANGACTTF